MSELGALVKGFRRGRALSQRALAKMAGVSVDSIVQVEAGREPRPATLRKLAEGLGVEIERLTGGVSPPSGATPGLHSPGSGAAAVRGSRAGDEGHGAGAVYGTLEDRGREAYGAVLAGSRLALSEALARARGAPLGLAGVRDEAELPLGEGLSDEVVAQRRSRPY